MRVLVQLSVEFHPRANRFRVGQKCEAIDLKSFSGRPCPATIVNVDGDHVTISYDGWNHAYNSIQRYDRQDKGKGGGLRLVRHLQSIHLPCRMVRASRARVAAAEETERFEQSHFVIERGWKVELVRRCKDSRWFRAFFIQLVIGDPLK